MSTSGQGVARKFVRISGDRRFFFLRVGKPQFVNALAVENHFRLVCWRDLRYNISIQLG